MLSLYQRSGRLSTEIEPIVEILDNNRVNLTYNIEESDIAEVSKIIILNNKFFSSSKIKSIMKTKERKQLIRIVKLKAMKALKAMKENTLKHLR